MSNIELKRLLSDFEVLIRTQITTFQADTNIADKAPLDQLSTDLQAQRTRLSNPSLWGNEVVYKESDFTTAFLNLMAIKPPKVQALIDEFNSCVVLIDKVFEETSEQNETTMLPWNLKAHEAMRQVEHKMVGRTNHFLQKGINLNDDTSYTSVAEPLKGKRRKYKEGLRNSSIKADATHEILLNRIGEAIQTQEEVPNYIQRLTALSTFLDSHIPTA